MTKRTWRPNKDKHQKVSGWRNRSASVIKSRRAKGRARLSA